MVYVNAGTQTKWAGLTQRETVRPDILLSAPPNTTTPPDEMITGKPQFVYGVTSIAQPQFVPHRPAPPPSSLLERRQNRLGLDAHIPMPSASLSDLNDEGPMSPPTTRALLSPLPEANKRHAGHTPLIPRALSPAPGTLPEEQAPEQDATNDQNASPDLDQALTGALTLPSNPVDGAEDRIELSALDKVLGKIAKQQAELRGEFDDEPAPKPDPKTDEIDLEDGLRLSRKGSADSHRSGATEEVDGVILKSPPSNFGAPLGSL
jgi:hypothetical protein